MVQAAANRQEPLILTLTCVSVRPMNFFPKLSGSVLNISFKSHLPKTKDCYLKSFFLPDFESQHSYCYVASWPILLKLKRFYDIFKDMDFRIDIHELRLI